MILIQLICCILWLGVSDSYKILGVFPYNGKSHHIIFSAFMEELADRHHEVTVINYFPMKKIANIKQISLMDPNEDGSDTVDIQAMYDTLPYYFRELYMAMFTVKVFENIANTNCQKIIRHPEILELIRSDNFDLIIVEQFISDCALGLVHHFKSPSIGMSAHVLMPWTYARFGIVNHPAYVPHHFTGTGTQLSLWGRIKCVILNIYFNTYHKYIIQRNDLETIREILPNTPDLEVVANNLTLMLINEYFPLTGSRLFPANVVEVGGMHIKQRTIVDKELLDFIEGATDGVVYISLGTVAIATSLPDIKVKGLLSFIGRTRQRFIWKREDTNLTDAPANLMIRDWVPQVDILCHPKVVGFISHSGMLSSAESIHCGVPMINVPLFGDQFANAASARETGAGVTVHYDDFDEKHLKAALAQILQPEHVTRVKQLSSLWRDRPESPMDTAVFWAEFVARHRGAPQLTPPTVDLPLYQYFMLDILSVLTLIALWMYIVVKAVQVICTWSFSEKNLKIDKKIKRK